MRPIGSTLLLLAALAPGVAFLSPVGGTWQVWFADGTAPAHPVTSGGADKIDVSAARTGELFVLERGGRGVFVDAAGQVAEALYLAPDADRAAVSPDGQRVAYTREVVQGKARNREIWLVERRGGARRALVDHAILPNAPAFSPDGRRLAYTARSDGGTQDVFVRSLDGHDERQLTAGSRSFFDPVYTPAGDLVVTTPRGGGYELWRISPRDMTAAPLDSPAAFVSDPAVDPATPRLFFVAHEGARSAVWTSGLGGADPRLFAEGSGTVRRPAWVAAPASDDGRAGRALAADVPAAEPGPAPAQRLYFLRSTNGRWQPWTAKPDGSGLAQVASIAADVSRLSASRDGRILLASSLDGSFWRIDTASGRVQKITVDPGGSTDGVITPDGTSIVYSCNIQNAVDANDLWIAPIAGGTARRITDQPYLQHAPAVAPDGVVYYLSGRGGQTHDVWRVGLDGKDARAVVTGHLYNFDPAVSGTGTVAFSSNAGGSYQVWALEPGAPQPVRLTNDPAHAAQPAFSPDGTSLYFVSHRDGPATLYVIDRRSGVESRVPIDGPLRSPVVVRDGGER